LPVTSRDRRDGCWWRWSRSTRAEDVIVVARAQSGDRQALDQVLRSLQEPLFEHVRAIVGDSDTAKDVLQETLWTIARKLSSLRDPRWLRAWSYRIATREAVHRTHAEKRWTQALRGEAMESLPVDEEKPHFDPETLAALPAQLEKLSPASRVVLRMHYLDALTHEEISEALEIALGTVKSRLSYGLAALRRNWAGAPS
jgi:RNA polymerase sigma-70 factor (ECF subfamily)